MVPGGAVALFRTSDVIDGLVVVSVRHYAVLSFLNSLQQTFNDRNILRAGQSLGQFVRFGGEMADRCLVTGRQQLPVAIATVRCYRAIDGEALVGCYGIIIESIGLPSLKAFECSVDAIAVVGATRQFEYDAPKVYNSYAISRRCIPSETVVTVLQATEEIRLHSCVELGVA